MVSRYVIICLNVKIITFRHCLAILKGSISLLMFFPKNTQIEELPRCFACFSTLPCAKASPKLYSLNSDKIKLENVHVYVCSSLFCTSDQFEREDADGIAFNLEADNEQVPVR